MLGVSALAGAAEDDLGMRKWVRHGYVVVLVAQYSDGPIIGLSQKIEFSFESETQKSRL